MTENTEIPEISIIVPVYKVEQYLPRCLNSIQMQTFKNWECILIDDGSPDKSGIICDEYCIKDKRFIVIHQANKGVSAVRNIGLNVAKGNYISFVDSDDWIEPDYLERLFKETEKADVVICDAYINTDDVEIIQKQIIKQSKYECLQDLIKDDIPGFLWIKLIKHDLITANNISFEKGVDLCEDVLFSIKVFYFANTISHVSTPLYHYVQNQGSYTNTKITFEKAKQLITCIYYIEQFLEDKSEYELLQSLKKRKILTKLWILFKGEKEVQKMYLNLWPETLTIINSLNLSFINKLMLKKSINKPNYALLLLRLRNKYVKIRDGKRVLKKGFKTS